MKYSVLLIALILTGCSDRNSPLVGTWDDTNPNEAVAGKKRYIFANDLTGKLFASFGPTNKCSDTSDWDLEIPFTYSIAGDSLHFEYDDAIPYCKSQETHKLRDVATSFRVSGDTLRFGKIHEQWPLIRKHQ